MQKLSKNLFSLPWKPSSQIKFGTGCSIGYARFSFLEKEKNNNVKNVYLLNSRYYVKHEAKLNINHSPAKKIHFLEKKRLLVYFLCKKTPFRMSSIESFKAWKMYGWKICGECIFWNCLIFKMFISEKTLRAFVIFFLTKKKNVCTVLPSQEHDRCSLSKKQGKFRSSTWN